MPEERSAGLRTELIAIRELKTKLEASHAAAVETGEKVHDDEADRLQREIEAKLKTLREKLNPFEAELHVREQYERQTKILKDVGILETWAKGDHAGERGVTGIDGQRYPIPTLEEVTHRLMIENREIVKTKAEQGFTKMILVPFGMSIDAFIDKYRAALQKHFDGGRYCCFTTCRIFQEKGTPGQSVRK